VNTTALRSLRYALVLSATTAGAWSLARASAQPGAETITWTFAGNPVGSNTYRTLPDGRFESTSDEKVRNTTIVSKLTGTVVNGVLTEYELVNNESGREVKVTARQGRAHITRQGKTSEVAFTPAKAFFANEHTRLAETLLAAIDPDKEGAQFIQVFLLDQAIPASAELRKKETLTIQRGDTRTTVTHYLFYVARVLRNLYVTEDGRFVSMDTPLQGWRATRAGYEASMDALIRDPAIRFPELSPRTMVTTGARGVTIKMRDGTELVADIFRPAGDGRHPAILRRTPYGRGHFPVTEGVSWASQLEYRRTKRHRDTHRRCDTHHLPRRRAAERAAVTTTEIGRF
jgi:hypothetical protein